MGRPTNLKHIQIYMTQESREIIISHAKNKGFRVMADYIRKLIEADINAEPDMGISLTIKRGKARKDR